MSAPLRGKEIIHAVREATNIVREEFVTLRKALHAKADAANRIGDERQHQIYCMAANMVACAAPKRVK